MKKLLLVAAVLVSLFSVYTPAVPVYAADVDVLSTACEDHPGADACIDRNDAAPQNRIYGPNGILTKIANLISVVVGIASVIMIIIAGFKYVIASGDPSNIKSAKDTLMYAIVGLIVAAMSQAIVLFVLSRL